MSNRNAFPVLSVYRNSCEQLAGLINDLQLMKNDQNLDTKKFSFQLLPSSAHRFTIKRSRRSNSLSVRDFA